MDNERNSFVYFLHEKGLFPDRRYMMRRFKRCIESIEYYGLDNKYNKVCLAMDFLYDFLKKSLLTKKTYKKIKEGLIKVGFRSCEDINIPEENYEGSISSGLYTIGEFISDNFKLSDTENIFDTLQYWKEEFTAA